MSHWLLDQDKFQQILASLRVPALRVDGRPGGGPLALSAPRGCDISCPLSRSCDVRALSNLADRLSLPSSSFVTEIIVSI